MRFRAIPLLAAALLASLLAVSTAHARFTAPLVVSSQPAFDIAAAVDGRGLTNIAFARGSDGSANRQILTAFRTASGRFYEPSPFLVVPLAGQLKLATNDSGGAVMVWSQRTTAGGPAELHASFRSPSQRFTPPLRISDPGEDAGRDYDVVLGNDGVATFVWNGEAEGGAGMLRLARRSFLEEVTEPSNLAAPTSFGLAKGPAGQLALAYGDGTNVLVTIAQAGGQFASPQIVAPIEPTTNGPVPVSSFAIGDVAIARDGTLAISWQDGGSVVDGAEGDFSAVVSHVAVNTPPDSDFAVQPVRTGTNTFPPALGFDAGGLLSLAWDSASDGLAPDRVDVAVHVPDGAYLAWRTLFDGRRASLPSLAVDDAGTTLITFAATPFGRSVPSAATALRASDRPWTGAAVLARFIRSTPRVNAADGVATFAALVARRAAGGRLIGIPAIRQWLS